MPADLLSAAATVVSWGATYFVHSTLLIGGVWLFLRLHRSAGHQVREALWKTALVGGLVTTPMQILFDVPGPLGEWRLHVPEGPPARTASKSAGTDRPGSAARSLADAGAEAAARRPEPDAAAELPAEIWFIFATADAAGTNAGSDVATAGRTTGEASAPSPATRLAALAGVLRGPVLINTLLALLSAVAAAGVARCFWQSLSLRRRLQDATPIVDGTARQLLDELSRHVPGTPPVRLLSAPDCPEPAAFGVARWTIVLPARAERDLSDDELRSLLAHELAHLVRGDMLWLLVSRVICSLLGFQPLNHIARREWQRSAEYLCDAWAVTRTGSRMALARCLAEVAGWRLRARVCAASLAATGRKSGLADRIERLVDDAPLVDATAELHRRRRLPIVIGAVLGLLISCGPRFTFSAQRARAIEAAKKDSTLNDAHRTDRDASERTVISPADRPDAATPDRSSPVRRDEPEAAGQTATPVVSAAEIAALLAGLERELAALEEEIVALGPLLEQSSPPPEAVDIVKRLTAEVVRLRKQRSVLMRILDGPVAQPAPRARAAPVRRAVL